MINLSRARDRMIGSHLSRRGIANPDVLEAMRIVPREAFVDPGFEEFAYEDSALSIGHGQTISQPYIVALMIERADIQPGDIVLEIGTGSGYAAAVLSRIAAHVYTIERHAGLAEAAERRFAQLGYAISTCGLAMAAPAGRKPAPSMRSSWPPVGRTCRKPSRSNWISAAVWSCPSAAATSSAS